MTQQDRTDVWLVAKIMLAIIAVIVFFCNSEPNEKEALGKRP